jgi:EAL domain-containing protein (putative c-di-GMP-specific phosphodiesterase class I)
MGMKTIAEFVETSQIKQILLEMDVDYAQGYAVHKPQPIEELF